MSLKWSPPQRKKLTNGGSKPPLSPNASALTSINTNTTNPSLAATTTTATTVASTSTKATTNTTIIKSTASTSNNNPQQQQQTQENITHKQQHTSAPLKLGGAKNSLKRSGTTIESTNSSMLSIYSTNSTNALLTHRNDDDDNDSTSSYGLYHKYSGHHHHSHNYHHSLYGHTHASGRGTGGSDSGSSSSRFGGGSLKRGKKQNWASRERAGMSFLIVIIFFAVFGVIILMELFMIDDRAHGGMMVVRHANNFGSRSGDSMPDYDNVKDDYDLLDENLLSDNKLGFVQFRDNKLKIQDADGDANGRVAGVLLNSGGVSANPQQQRGGGAAAGGGAEVAAGSNGIVGGAPGAGVVRTGGSGSSLIPWGKILPAKVEETLPHFPSGVQPIDGAWQVVNGTRFKFFVFSAYYDRRDGAKLVRVIGATKTRTPERVWCRFWYPRGGGEAKQQQQHQPPYVSATVMARVKVIRENWNLKYSAVFVLCPVRPAELEVPHYISIVARLRAPPGNLLQLRNTDWDPDFAHLRTPPAIANSSHSTQSNATTLRQQQSQSQPQSHLHQQQQYHQQHATMSPLGAQYLPFGLPTDEQIPDKIAVCVKPFHFNYDQALYLMEFLEFYALMGVAHFTFYNHTLGPHATCVLQHYIDGDVPNISTAWDIDLAEVAGKGVTLMGQDAAKVDAVLSGYYNLDNSKSNNNNNNNNLNTNNNQNNDNARQVLQSNNNNNNKKASVSANDGNHTKATNSAHSTIQTQSVLLATAFGEGEVTGALQPPPPPPPPQSQVPQPPQPPQPPHPPPPKPPSLQERIIITTTTMPPVRRYKSEHYTKPTINILPWNLRMRSQKEIRTEGLFAALNDCLYRTMHRYRYLAMVDLDEFIVPRHNDTLNELINSLNHRFRYRSVGAYSFQNAFFYLQFPDDPLVTLAHDQPPAAPGQQQPQQPYAHTNPVLRAALVTQRKTRRRLKLHPQKQRSKYICKPESVIEAGNHFVWEFSPAKGSLNVPPTDGILQHYRVCEFGGNDCIKAPSVVDRTATKYVNRLVERVELIYKHLKKPCDLPPLPNEPPEQSQSQRKEQQQQQQQQQQQRKLQSKSTGELSKERNQEERDNNNNNDNSKGVNSKKSSTTTNTKSDDERIKTLANVKSKRDNDRDTSNGSVKNQGTTIEGNGNSNDPNANGKQTEEKVKRKQRKVVVFEQDEEGMPIARVEYVDA